MGCIEKGKVTSSKADKSGHETPEDCRLPHQTVGVNGQFPVWLCPRQRHNRCNLCSQASANKRFYMTFVDLEKAFDGVPQKIIRWALRKLGVDCATGAGDVCQ